MSLVLVRKFLSITTPGTPLGPLYFARFLQSEGTLAMHALVAGTVSKRDSFRSRRALGHNPAIEKYTYPAAVTKTERYE